MAGLSNFRFMVVGFKLATPPRATIVIPLTSYYILVPELLLLQLIASMFLVSWLVQRQPLGILGYGTNVLLSNGPIPISHHSLETRITSLLVAFRLDHTLLSSSYTTIHTSPTLSVSSNVPIYGQMLLQSNQIQQRRPSSPSNSTLCAL